MQGRTELGTIFNAEHTHDKYLPIFCEAKTPDDERNAIASALSDLQHLFDVPPFGDGEGLAPELVEIVDMWGEAAVSCGVPCDMPYPTH